MLVACNNAHQYRRGWISPLIMRFSNRKSPPDYIRHDYREGVLIMLVDKETEERTNKCKGGKKRFSLTGNCCANTLMPGDSGV